MTPTSTPCRVLIGGFGRPGMRDLDFGRHVIDYFQDLEWPDGVVVEDLSCSAPLVLHRLQELRPAKVVLLGAVGRDLDPPATLRRYRPDLTAPDAAAVRRSVGESAMGMVDLDHTMVMARHWGGLPVDTVVIEVEPAEASFGLGFSDDLAGCMDPMLEMVREELAGLGASAGSHRDFVVDDLLPPRSFDQPVAIADGSAPEPSESITALLDYASDHAQARQRVERAPVLADLAWLDAHGVAVVGRVRPWGVFAGSGGDWFDALPLPDGRVGIVVGNVAGRGVEVAAAMSDLRAAARAYAVIDGESPLAMVRHLDRLAERTGMGRDARLLYLTLQPGTGEVCFSNAGNCPPLLVASASTARFADGVGGRPLGAEPGGERSEVTQRLEAGSTLLLFTDGLVQSRAVPRPAGLERLRRAAIEGGQELEDMCDQILTTCLQDLRRDDDICLVGVRLQTAVVSAPVRDRQRV